MKRHEHLLTILMEECNEVAQRASKILRFGFSEVQPGQELSNEDRLIQEFNDLYAMLSMLQEEQFIIDDSLIKQRYITAKKEKVEKFLLHSKEQGTLTL